MFSFDFRENLVIFFSLCLTLILKEYLTIVCELTNLHVVSEISFPVQVNAINQNVTLWVIVLHLI